MQQNVHNVLQARQSPSPHMEQGVSIAYLALVASPTVFFVPLALTALLDATRSVHTVLQAIKLAPSTAVSIARLASLKQRQEPLNVTFVGQVSGAMVQLGHVHFVTQASFHQIQDPATVQIVQKANGVMSKVHQSVHCVLQARFNQIKDPRAVRIVRKALGAMLEVHRNVHFVLQARSALSSRPQTRAVA